MITIPGGLVQQDPFPCRLLLRSCATSRFNAETLEGIKESKLHIYARTFSSNYKCLINKTKFGNECVSPPFSIFNGAAAHGAVLI